MTLDEVMAALAAAGTAQNRKVYPRHGIAPPLFGVSYKALGELAKRLKGRADLAPGLWASGNHDARVLATMLGAPDRRTAEAWARELDNYVLTDAFAKMVARQPYAAALEATWAKAGDEWRQRAGWLLVALTAQRAGPDSRWDPDWDPDWAAKRLGELERGLHQAPNRARDARLMALIALGALPSLHDAALAAARRIGPVAVDHGETGCKTPDPVAYIGKMAARAKGKR